VNSLTIRILVVIVPLAFLTGCFILSELIRRHRIKHARKRIRAGALKGLSCGPQIRI